MKKNFLSILCLTIAVALTAWFVLTTNTKHLGANQPNTPDSYMTDVYAVTLNKDGVIASVLISPKVTGYAENDKTNIQTPFVTIKPRQEPPWHIHADHAKVLDGNTKILLWGNVRISQLPGRNSHFLTLLTTELTLYPDKSFAETDQPVTIKQPGSIVHAIGMQADLNKGYIKLLSKTEGQYGSKPSK